MPLVKFQLHEMGLKEIGVSHCLLYTPMPHSMIMCQSEKSYFHLFSVTSQVTGHDLAAACFSDMEKEIKE